MLKKKTYVIFGKKNYLIGVNIAGEKVFLEEESWDCSWYWGIGYIKTYNNNRSPQNSKNICSHSHFENFRTDDGNIYILNDYHTLIKSTLNHEEMTKLKVLMQRAILLRQIAGRLHKCGKNVVQCEKYNTINFKYLPIIYKNMKKILE